MDLQLRRRFFAEEIEAVCKIQSPALVDAFAAVPRERFLPPGPWTVLAESALGLSLPRTRTTPDADPAHVCHNIAVAIDPARQLFNGQPGTLAVWIDALELKRGQRVLHIGCGLGYFTAILADCVGPTGRVVAHDVDETLAAGASRNLAGINWVQVQHSDASQIVPAAESFDAILVNAGVTHPLDAWLDALAPGGRMILPLTSSMTAVGTTLGKGLVFLVTSDADRSLAARVLTVVAIYSALGIRDDAMNERLGKAMMAGPEAWQGIKRLRRDPHGPGPACWYHASTCCLSKI
jgi:protein-L-isoaspartate(D-aspartate) O-methyltransferase